MNISRLKTISLVTVATTCLSLGFAATGAYAATGSWGELIGTSVYGAQAWHSGYMRGQVEDKNRGTRIELTANTRLQVNSTNNGVDRGAYTDANWKKNGAYCYVSSVSNSGGGVTCTTGWYSAGVVQSPRITRTGTEYTDMWISRSTGDNSAEVRLSVCFDLSWTPDNCSPGLIRGSSFN